MSPCGPLCFRIIDIQSCSPFPVRFVPLIDIYTIFLVQMHTGQLRSDDNFKFTKCYAVV